MKKTSTISLEELFSDIDLETAKKVDLEKISKEGKSELLQDELDSMKSRKSFLQFTVAAVGIGALVFMMSVFWLQVTYGYFDQVSQNKNDFKETFQRVTEVVNDVKVDIDNIKEVAGQVVDVIEAEIEATEEEKNNKIESVIELVGQEIEAAE